MCDSRVEPSVAPIALEVLGGSIGRRSAELDPASSQLKQRVETTELRHQLSAALQPVGMELEDDVTFGQAFTGLKVADPVMRDIRPDQHQLAGREDVDAVADHEPARALGDEVDLVFRVIVPPREWARNAVHVPPSRQLRIAGHHLSCRSNRGQPLRHPL